MKQSQNFDKQRRWQLERCGQRTALLLGVNRGRKRWPSIRNWEISLQMELLNKFSTFFLTSLFSDGSFLSVGSELILCPVAHFLRHISALSSTSCSCDYGPRVLIHCCSLKPNHIKKYYLWNKDYHTKSSCLTGQFNYTKVTTYVYTNLWVNFVHKQVNSLLILHLPFPPFLVENTLISQHWSVLWIIQICMTDINNKSNGTNEKLSKIIWCQKRLGRLLFALMCAG